MKYSQNYLFEEFDISNKEFDLKKWSQIIKQRDLFTCQFAEPGDERNHDGPVEAHHKFPKQYGGKNILHNGITLCKKCHAQFLIEGEQKYYFGVLNEFRLLLFDFLRKIVGFTPLTQYYKILYYLTRSKQFVGIQLQAIRTVVEEKKSVIIVSPTGSGKSLIYYMSGIILQVQTLVISPLIALQKDQVQKLWRKWIPATYINSELDKSEKNKRILNALLGKYSFVFAHPKQFLHKIEKTGEIDLKHNNPLFQAPMGILCIDEAHVVEKYGIHFIKEYDNLDLIRKVYHYPPTILLSASLTKKMQDKLRKDLFKEDEEVKVIVTGYYRPEITLIVKQFLLEEETEVVSKREYLKYLLQDTEEKTIVFATTTKEVDELTLYLKQCGFDAEGYHAKLPNAEKQFIHKLFSGDMEPEKSLQILVCTSALGMGLDFNNVNLAIHYTLPFSLNDYYQQFGRIGRDGKPSMAYLLVDQHDPYSMINFIQNKELETVDDSIQKKFLVDYYEQEKRDLMGYVRAVDKWQYILDYFGEKRESNKDNYLNVILIILLGILLMVIWEIIKTF